MIDALPALFINLSTLRNHQIEFPLPQPMSFSASFIAEALLDQIITQNFREFSISLGRLVLLLITGFLLSQE